MTASDLPAVARVAVYLLIVLAWLIPMRATYLSGMNGARKILLFTFTALISWPLSLALMAIYSVCFDTVPRDVWFITVGLNVALVLLVLKEWRKLK
jgi:hypothetical protein